ncbi:hypothetical protein ACFQ9X_20595 [Catenulispora yoronensis]
MGKTSLLAALAAMVAESGARLAAATRSVATPYPARYSATPGKRSPTAP